MKKSQQTVETVVAAIILRQQKGVTKLCMVRDTEDNTRVLPGGKLKNGDSPESGLLRELYDELRGTHFKIIRKLGYKFGESVHKKKRIKLIVYQVDITDEEPTPGEEIRIIDWLTKDEAKSLCVDKRYNISTIACRFIVELILNNKFN